MHRDIISRLWSQCLEDVSMDDEIPAFLTVEEAGRLLRIGRTKAYDLAKEWRATDGRSGLPVVDLGDLLRVPGPAIRKMLDTGLARIGEAPPEPVAGRRGPRASPSSAPTPPTRAMPASDVPQASVPRRTPRARRAYPESTTQLPLFQPLPFTPPDL
jgi:hypothetical protein